MSDSAKKVIVSVVSAAMGGLIVFILMNRTSISPVVAGPGPVAGVTVSKPGPLQADESQITENSVIEHEKEFQEMPEVTLPFDSFLNSKFGRDHAQNITKREDQAFVYFDIAIDDVKSTSIKTSVKGGYITISGDTEKAVDDAVFRSTFKRTFPVPENAIENSLQTHTEQGKIILRFAKKA